MSTPATLSRSPRDTALVTYFDGDLYDRTPIRVSLRGNLRTGKLHVRVRRQGLTASTSFPAAFTRSGLAAEAMQRAFVLARELHVALHRPRIES